MVYEASRFLEELDAYGLQSRLGLGGGWTFLVIEMQNVAIVAISYSCVTTF